MARDGWMHTLTGMGVGGTAEVALLELMMCQVEFSGLRVMVKIKGVGKIVNQRVATLIPHLVFLEET